LRSSVIGYTTAMSTERRLACKSVKSESSASQVDCTRRSPEGGDHVQADRSERSEERQRDSADAARERSDGTQGQGHRDGQPSSPSVPAGHAAGAGVRLGRPKAPGPGEEPGRRGALGGEDAEQKSQAEAVPGAQEGSQVGQAAPLRQGEAGTPQEQVKFPLDEDTGPQTRVEGTEIVTEQ
jgi:hypothetical protein